MAANPQVGVDAKKEFVDDCLKAFELDGDNRDVVLAECLFYLRRMDAVVTETVTRMSSGPMAGMLGKLAGGR